MRTKIFITGINGFIGSHLAIKLFEKGFHVIGGDRTEEPNQILKDYSDSLSFEKRSELQKYLEIFVIDFSSAWHISSFKDISLIYHFASPIGVQNIINNSGKTLRESEKINTYVDKICTKYTIPIVYASSSEVFGSTTVTSDSNYNIKKFKNSPRWSYAAAKVHGEFLFSTGEYSSTIVRFFNVVGQGQSTKGMVVPTFIDAAINNKDLVILEDGIRSYCDVREAVSYLTIIGDNILDKPDTIIKDEYNIGNENNFCDATYLAEKIIELFESDSNIVYDSNFKNSNFLKLRKLKLSDEMIEMKKNIKTFNLEEILLNIKEQL